MVPGRSLCDEDPGPGGAAPPRIRFAGHGLGDDPTGATSGPRACKVTGSRFPAGCLGQPWAAADTEAQRGLGTQPGCTARAARSPKSKGGHRPKGGGRWGRTRVSALSSGLKWRQSPASAPPGQEAGRGVSAEGRGRGQNDSSEGWKSRTRAPTAACARGSAGGQGQGSGRAPGLAQPGRRTPICVLRKSGLSGTLLG